MRNLLVLLLIVSFVLSQTHVCKTPTGTDCVTASTWPNVNDNLFKPIPLLISPHSKKPVFQLRPGSESIMNDLTGTRKLVMPGSIPLAKGCAVSCEWFAQNSVPTCTDCVYPFVIYSKLATKKRCIDFDEDISLKNLPASQIQALFNICKNTAKCNCKNQDAPLLSSVEMKKFLLKFDPFKYSKQPIRSGGEARSGATNTKILTGRMDFLKTAIFRKGETCTEGINVPFMEFDDELETLKANGLSHFAEKSLVAKETYTITIVLETLRVPERYLTSHIASNGAGFKQLFGVVSGTNSELEQKLAYFREDLWYTFGHHQWHNIYKGNFVPITWHAMHFMPRHGESFLYFHRQLLVRNNAERYALKVPLVVPMSVNGEYVVGYTPKYVVTF